MIEKYQMLTDGLIIFSVLVSDYEKFDFKDDALAGVRANYFNSHNSNQADKTEILLNGITCNLSYNMCSNKALSWKVTSENIPFQSVKRINNDLYSVIFYGENGVIYKRQLFNNEHLWIRTEYFNRTVENKLVCRIAPVVIENIIALSAEYIHTDGSTDKKILFPTDKMPNHKTNALIYSNVGMLWYDEEFKPENIDVQEDKLLNSSTDRGFTFNETCFLSSYMPKKVFDMNSADYLLDESEDLESDNVEFDNSEKDNKPSAAKSKEYSAYDKINRILQEAHKSNKDLFGEIINQTEDDFGLISEQLNNDDNTDDEIEAKVIEKRDDADNKNDNIVENIDTVEAVNSAKELSESSDNSEIISEKADDVQLTDNSLNTSNSDFLQNEISANLADNNDTNTDNEKFDVAERSSCDAVIITKSGRYTYYGDLDKNNCRTGKGRTLTPQGSVSYDGEYLDDKRNGFGVCYYNNGNINYVGQWQDNNRNGCGVGYRLSDSTMHIGKWENNTPTEYGARFDSYGNFIDVCMYKDGYRNGNSISFDENGNIIISVYANGEKISEKVIFTED